MNCSATILTHPAFDRPQVKQNPSRGRRPKSIINIQTAGIAVKLAREKAQSASTPTNSLRTACAQLQQFEKLLRTSNEEGANCMLMMLNVALEVEINRRIEKEVHHGK